MEGIAAIENNRTYFSNSNESDGGAHTQVSLGNGKEKKDLTGMNLNNLNLAQSNMK